MSKTSILLVDDDLRNSERCREIIEGEGFEVREATTLEETIGELAQGGIDLILIDLLLPDGPSLRYVADHAASIPPAMAMTGIYLGQRAQERLYAAYPFKRVLEKPISATILVDTLRDYFGEMYPQPPTTAVPELISRDEIEPIRDQIIPPSANLPDPVPEGGAAESMYLSDDTQPEQVFGIGPEDHPTPAKEFEAPWSEADVTPPQEPAADDTEFNISEPDTPFDTPFETREDIPQPGGWDVPSAVEPSGPREVFQPPQVVPHSVDPEHAPLQGRLELVPIATVLTRLFRERRTGAVRLVRDRVKKLLYVQDGQPVSMRSNILYECLGQMLTKEKMISPQECEESVRRMKAEGKLQGAILVEMGCLSPQNLIYALDKQFKAKFVDVFTWDQGLYQFSEDTPLPKSFQAPEDSPYDLTLMGMREGFGLERVVRDLTPYLTHTPILKGDRAHFRQLKLVGVEREVLGKLRPDTTIVDVVSQVQATPKVYIFLYALACMGFLAFTPPHRHGFSQPSQDSAMDEGWNLD